MHFKTIKPYIIAVFIITLAACSNNNFYMETVKIPENGWYKDQAASFDVTVEDTLVDYDFYLIIRNNNQYRYSNLFVFLNTVLPNGNKTRDTIELVLADNYGKWLGKGWGAVKENKLLLKKSLRFPLKGEYNFFVQQAMRVDTLKGITDVGLQLTKSE
jgi:gliding motility-associated lipoprotein GldH